jgi:hypothetical protein
MSSLKHTPLLDPEDVARFKNNPAVAHMDFVKSVLEIQKKLNPMVDAIAVHSNGLIPSAGLASQPRFCSNALWVTKFARETLLRNETPEHNARLADDLLAPDGCHKQVVDAFEKAHEQYLDMEAAVYAALPPGMRDLYSSTTSPRPTVAKMLDDIIAAYHDSDADADLIKLINAEIATDSPPLIPAVFEVYEQLISRLSEAKRMAHLVPETMIAGFIAKLPIYMRSDISAIVTREFPLRNKRTWHAFKDLIAPHVLGAFQSRTASTAGAANGVSFGHASDAPTASDVSVAAARMTPGVTTQAIHGAPSFKIAGDESRDTCAACDTPGHVIGNCDKLREYFTEDEGFKRLLKVNNKDDKFTVYIGKKHVPLTLTRGFANKVRVTKPSQRSGKAAAAATTDA